MSEQIELTQEETIDFLKSVKKILQTPESVLITAGIAVSAIEGLSNTIHMDISQGILSWKNPYLNIAFTRNEFIDVILCHPEIEGSDPEMIQSVYEFGAVTHKLILELQNDIFAMVKPFMDKQYKAEDSLDEAIQQLPDEQKLSGLLNTLTQSIDAIESKKS